MLIYNSRTAGAVQNKLLLAFDVELNETDAENSPRNFKRCKPHSIHPQSTTNALVCVEISAMFVPSESGRQISRGHYLEVPVSELQIGP